MRLTFLILDLSLDIVNGVRGLDIKSDGLTGECFYENLGREEERVNVRKGGPLKNKYNVFPTTI